MDDEEYIALGFEKLGHEIIRIEDSTITTEICELLGKSRPDLVLWTKLRTDDPTKLREYCRRQKLTTVCWVFDLYFDYHREYQLRSHPAFTADYVFTTDGGHEHEFKTIGIKHKCVRQGIANAECFLEPFNNPKGAVFVGTDNPTHPYRTEMITVVKNHIQDFEWIGRGDPREMRGPALNKLYSTKKLVIGDSVYSPHYWSNRVVETLGRGGFLIHPEVEGIKEEYPHLITYKRGDFDELRKLLTYYNTHEEERQEVVKKNFEWVRDNYTVDKKCAELLSHIVK